jgi:DNA invertase Pin-like site-specific DNA recombinase
MFAHQIGSRLCKVHLLGILKKIDEAGAKFRSLGEAIETESASGRMIMQMLGTFAEFEREIIQERIKRGLAPCPKVQG